MKANTYETLRLEHSGWINVDPTQPLTNSDRFSIFGPNVLSSGDDRIWEVTGSAGKVTRIAITVTFTPFSGGAPVTRVAAQNITSGMLWLFKSYNCSYIFKSENIMALILQVSLSTV